MELKLLRINAVLEKTGMGKTKLYRLISQDKFPRPVAIEGTRAWRSTDIEKWIKDLPIANAAS